MPPSLQKVVVFVREVVAYFKQNPIFCFLLLLNLFGLFLFARGLLKANVRPALFLGMLSMIMLLVSFLFLRGIVLSELDRHVIDMDAHPGGIEQLAQDMARMGNAIAQINEAIGEMGQIKEFIADFDSYKKGLSAIRQDVAGVPSIREDLARLTEELNQLKETGGEGGSAEGVSDAIDGLKKSLEEAATGREALSKAVIALKADVQELQSHAASSTEASDESEEAAAPSVPEGLAEKIEELEAKLAAIPEAQPTDAEGVAEKMKEWTDTSEELEGRLSTIQEQMDKVGKQLKKLDGTAKAASGEGPGPEIVEELEALKEEIAEVAKTAGAEVKELGDDLRQEIAGMKSQIEGVSEIGDVTEAISTLRDEVADLRGKMKTGGGKRSKGAPVDADLQSEVEELRKAVADFAASQPKLEVDVKKATLTPQQDRTMIQCTLTVKNQSNRPNEIVAVRAELDSGRDRMTPTSVRHWIPEGTEVNSDRRVFLPMNVLEQSETDPVELTVAGWPLEKKQDKYTFRITLKDKSGNEFVKTLDLKPDKKKT